MRDLVDATIEKVNNKTIPDKLTFPLNTFCDILLSSCSVIQPRKVALQYKSTVAFFTCLSTLSLLNKIKTHSLLSLHAKQYS